MAMVPIEAIVTEKTLVTPYLGLFKIAPEGAIPKFEPGQFMMVGTDVDGKYQKRAYSIVSPPYAIGHVEFCIKAYEEGKVAKHLLALPNGARVKLEGPYGKFVLNGSPKDKLFIAAGTGIAPVLSMIKTLFHRGFGGRVRLFYGASYPHTLVYADELHAHTKKHDNFTFVPTVSRDVQGWAGEKGRVETVLPKHIKDAENFEAFICGPPPMVQNSAAYLKSVGFADADVHMEQYW
ncbi:MAG: hypothetical protein HYS81_01245 [Candidatus Aenigmatarchaeota archaeon]|nr:MAG: hypothetical protein HYS81_01245 [Candidatus Aenigmarchaeota archaeon]